jgi:fused signal recognition particle receptor
MGLFEKFKIGLKKTAQQLTGNLESLLKGSVKLSEATLEQMEESLVACDMGTETAQAIVREVEEGMKREQGADSGLLARH